MSSSRTITFQLSSDQKTATFQYILPFFSIHSPPKKIKIELLLMPPTSSLLHCCKKENIGFLHFYFSNKIEADKLTSTNRFFKQFIKGSKTSTQRNSSYCISQKIYKIDDIQKLNLWGFSPPNSLLRLFIHYSSSVKEWEKLSTNYTHHLVNRLASTIQAKTQALENKKEITEMPREISFCAIKPISTERWMNIISFKKLEQALDSPELSLEEQEWILSLFFTNGYFQYYYLKTTQQLPAVHQLATPPEHPIVAPIPVRAAREDKLSFSIFKAGALKNLSSPAPLFLTPSMQFSHHSHSAFRPRVLPKRNITVA